MPENNNEKEIIKKEDKWEFEDYAFLITGIIVFVLLVLPDIIYSAFGINILGGSLGNVGYEIIDELEAGSGNVTWNLTSLRTLSPFLFLLTATIVMFYDAYQTRKTGGYEGSMFTHTFESTLEDAIYMAIMTIMVYSSVLTNSMYASWLTGPIAWVLFVFIFPLVKKTRQTGAADDDEYKMPWFLLSILFAGFIAELFIGTWFAFPFSWLIICAFKFSQLIRSKDFTLDIIFNLIYYTFSVILMTLGILLGYWLTSWASFPIALVICWILSKTKRFKKPEKTTPDDQDV